MAEILELLFLGAAIQIFLYLMLKDITTGC